MGVTGFEIGVVGFSLSSIFLAEGVLALLLVPLLGDGGGTSFFTWLLKGTEDGPSSAPRSRRQPPNPGRSFHHRFAIGENVHGFIKGIPSAAGHGEPSWDTYMAYILVLLLLHLLEWEVIVVLGVG